MGKLDSVRTILATYRLDTGQAVSGSIKLMGTTDKLGASVRTVTSNYKAAGGALISYTEKILASEKAVRRYNKANMDAILTGKKQLGRVGGVAGTGVTVTQPTPESQRKGGLFGTGDKPGMILAKVASWTIATGAIFGTIGALKKV